MKFFNSPRDPESYLTLLRSKLRQAKDVLEENCVTASDAQFKKFASDVRKIEKEIKSVEKIQGYKSIRKDLLGY